MQKCVYVLGHQINEKGYAPDHRKLTNVESWPVPKSSSEIMSLLGFFGYFRQFIPHMSDITKPLDDLRYSKDVVRQWGQQQEKAFTKLKQALLNAPILSFPDMSKRFYIATDASNVGISAVYIKSMIPRSITFLSWLEP